MSLDCVFVHRLQGDLLLHPLRPETIRVAQRLVNTDYEDIVSLEGDMASYRRLVELGLAEFDNDAPETICAIVPTEDLRAIDAERRWDLLEGA